MSEKLMQDLQSDHHSKVNRANKISRDKIYRLMIDYIFGQNEPKQKSPQKELKVQIKTPASKKKPELTALQKYKLEAKKQLKQKQQQILPELSENHSVSLEQEGSLHQGSKLSQNSDGDFDRINRLLDGEFENSEKLIGFEEKEAIKNKLFDLENHVYNAQTSGAPEQYLSEVYRQLEPSNEFLKEEIGGQIANVMKNIKNDILYEHEEKQGLVVNMKRNPSKPKKHSKSLNVEKKRIPRTKDDLRELEEINKYKMIKIRNGEVKSKVDDLRKEIEMEYHQNKHKIHIDTSDIVEKGYFSMNHPETRKAEHFIRELNQKRRSEKNYYRHLNHIKETKENRQKQMEKVVEERLRSQRRHDLEQMYQQKHLKKQQEVEDLERKRQEYKNWMKLYQKEKPLEEKLQEEMVMKLIVPELENRHKRLMQIKTERPPIDIDDINDHDVRYMEFKRDEEIRQRAEYESRRETQLLKEEEQQRYYKGKYRLMALESMFEENNQVEDREIERSKRERQLAYSDYVKADHRPRLRKIENMDATKNLIQRVRNNNGSLAVNESISEEGGNASALSDRNQIRKRQSQTLDAKKEGLKNLNYVKSRVRDKLAHGDQKRPIMHLIEQKNRYSYLDAMKDEKQKKKNEQSLHRKPERHSNHAGSQQRSRVYANSKKADIAQSSVLDSYKSQTQNLDERLKRKEFKKKFHKNEPLTEGVIEENAEMEKEYLEAIKAKLRIDQEMR